MMRFKFYVQYLNNNEYHKETTHAYRDKVSFWELGAGPIIKGLFDSVFWTIIFSV